ncbi:Protein TOXD [Cyphellophora attinorum]|uniref:Protein TOXD n=1 Tax=Cyphellophora attinorum TaxID=1664694 RepID=A0A0N0NPC9_9EURO|nr:Protein TOXD [Phialophora attinorum]KPI42578.1 Protein TOXD [Phialophora attinorum]
MATMKALTIKEKGGAPVLIERPIPFVRPTYMLVKVAAVGLNPADALCLDYGMNVPGHMMGCDWAGTVVEVGEDVTRDFKPGERVAGMCRSAEPFRDDVGCFSEYAVVKADLALHIPDSMPFTDAAALGVAVVTTGRCLFDTFNIPYPVVSPEGKLSPPTSTAPQQILIYGGSTSMGTLTTQFAKLAGLHVLTTSSPTNHAMVKSLSNPDFIVDHYSPSAPAELLAESQRLTPTHGPLRMCMDTISSASSAVFCCKVLNPSAMPPGLDTPVEWVPAHVESDLTYSTIGPLTPPLPGIQTKRRIGFSFLGEEWAMLGPVQPANVGDFERSRAFAVVAERCLAGGLVKPHVIEVQEGGLEAIPGGIERYRKGLVSGRKLVYVV